MKMSKATRQAQAIAIALPAALLGGALISEYVFGLYPCEMCWWQRYAHIAALAIALASTIAQPRRLWIAVAGLCILVAGLIGAFHAGVEYDWWEGITTCASITNDGGDPLQAIFDAPIVRCDEAPWTLFGISLAGFNFLISTAGAFVIFVLLNRKTK